MRAKKLVLKRARIQEMASEDVRNLLGEEKYRAIKSGDSHPFFVELLVAHEGVSRGKILGATRQGRSAKKFWSKARIEELVKKLAEKVVPIYLFHDNSNRPRRKVGEIIAAISQKVKERFSALAYAYISDPEVRELIRKRKLDTCSLEAELEFERWGKSDHAPGMEWVVNAIEAVSGLALGSKKAAKPGFPGAAILAQVEEFLEENDSGEQTPGGKESVELEQALVEKEDELTRLKSELVSLQKEREKEERKKKVVEMVNKQIAERNLKREEKKLVLDEVSERVELKQPDEDGLEKVVKEEVDRELAKLAELRKLYQRADAFLKNSSAPLEPPKASTQNPLIPKA